MKRKFVPGQDLPVVSSRAPSFYEFPEREIISTPPKGYQGTVYRVTDGEGTGHKATPVSPVAKGHRIVSRSYRPMKIKNRMPEWIPNPLMIPAVKPATVVVRPPLFIVNRMPNWSLQTLMRKRPEDIPAYPYERDALPEKSAKRPLTSKEYRRLMRMHFSRPEWSRGRTVTQEWSDEEYNAGVKTFDVKVEQILPEIPDGELRELIVSQLWDMRARDPGKADRPPEQLIVSSEDLYDQIINDESFDRGGEHHTLEGADESLVNRNLEAGSRERTIYQHLGLFRLFGADRTYWTSKKDSDGMVHWKVDPKKLSKFRADRDHGIRSGALLNKKKDISPQKAHALLELKAQASAGKLKEKRAAQRAARKALFGF